MRRAVLAFNAGSSSLRFALYAADEGGSLDSLLSGKADGLGENPAIGISDGARHALAAGATHEDALTEILAHVRAALGHAHLVAIGHRVVHGGPRHAAPARLDETLLAELEGLVSLAPLHQTHAITAIRAAASLLPGVPQIACFDTSFHHDMPDCARRVALPDTITGTEIRRYGFHGLSYAYIARRLAWAEPALAAGRVIAAHLGSGASLCAMRGGRSIETTMGFTPLDGLVMGTRCGSLDPGLVLHLLRVRGLDPAALEEILTCRSGLRALSGHSGDMRTILEGRDKRDQFAADMFAYRAAAGIGALAVALGGVDGLVFTAGIGEHAARVREAICARLGLLGIVLDPALNVAGTRAIDAAESRVAVRVMHTDEARMVAELSLAEIGKRP